MPTIDSLDIRLSTNQIEALFRKLEELRQRRGYALSLMIMMLMDLLDLPGMEWEFRRLFGEFSRWIGHRLEQTSGHSPLRLVDLNDCFEDARLAFTNAGCPSCNGPGVSPCSVLFIVINRFAHADINLLNSLLLRVLVEGTPADVPFGPPPVERKPVKQQSPLSRFD